MKKFFASLVLILVLFGSCTFAFASDSADALYELGLFLGTGKNADGSPNFSLNRVPTRAEAVTMLVRLLGKEEEALAGDWETPFSDVNGWAEPYIGYAYANGLTKGISNETFGSSNASNETQYLTFVLRAMGYDDTKGDFAWNKARALSDEIGITSANAASKTFTRADVADISYNALDVSMKGSDQSLAEKLIKERVFTAEDYYDVSGQLKENSVSRSKSSAIIPFGDDEINDSLLALNPDRIEKPFSDDGRLYHVIWNDHSMWGKITNALDKTHIGYSKEAGEVIDSQCDWTGTRVEVYLCDNGTTSYMVEKFVPGGKVHAYKYSTDIGDIDPQTSRFKLPFGEEEVNRLLLSLKPDNVVKAMRDNDRLYHVVWNNTEAFNKVAAALDSSCIASSKNDYGIVATSYNWTGTRVELYLADDGKTNYSVEQFTGDGKHHYISYSNRFVDIYRNNQKAGAAEQIDSIPIGIAEINADLIAMNADRIQEAGQKDGKQYHIIWNDIDMFTDVLEYMNSSEVSEWNVSERIIPSQMEMTGTRVEIVDIGTVIYHVEKISDNMIYDVSFTNAKTKETASQKNTRFTLEKLPIGIRRINDELFTMRPDYVFEAGYLDGTMYHMRWNDTSMCGKLIELLNSLFDSNIKKEEDCFITDMQWSGTRVEITDGEYPSYKVESFDGKGNAYMTSYYF